MEKKLTEALGQQTATSEVLQVISSSPGELKPVFEAMLEKAMHLCEAAFGGLWMFKEDRYVAVALRGVPQVYAAFIAETTVIPGPGTAPYRLRHGERLVHNIDLASEEPYRAGDPQRCALVDIGGARTALQVALRKEDAVLGVITIYRQEVRPFSDRQIALVQNFAAQAVIAIENTRLLNELRQRTDDLSELLQQQTATAEVLSVISGSPGELGPVFESLLANAVRLCVAKFGTLYVREGDSFRAVAIHNAPPAYAEARKRGVIRPPPDTSLGRMARTRQVAQVADVRATQSYVTGDPFTASAVDLGGYRSVMSVPMLKGEELVGAITIHRQEVCRFSDKQIGVVSSFAKQAVIAIENTRLLNELRESLQQQTATADVLKVISRSAFDLQAVLDTLFRISGAPLRGGSRMAIPPRRRHLSLGRELRPFEGGTRAHQATHADPTDLSGARDRSLDGPRWKANRSKSPTRSRTRNMSLARRRRSRASEPYWAHRFYAKACRLAPSVCSAPTSGRLPTNRSSCSPPSPTRR